MSKHSVENKTRDNFTIIPNDLIRDDSISDRARFVYIVMSSKPEGWKFYNKTLAKEMGYSIETLRKYVKELTESGWVVRGDQDVTDGQFGAVGYTINYDKTPNLTVSEKVPHGEKPCTENTDTNKDLLSNTNKPPIVPHESIDRIYAEYPGKCPIYDRALGKSHSDKKKIEKVMKEYDEDTMINVIRAYIDNCKDTQTPLKNFSTFLNNFPDPESILKVNPDREEMNVYGMVLTKAEWKEMVPYRDAHNKFDLDMQIDNMREIEDDDEFYEKISKFVRRTKAAELLYGITYQLPADIKERAHKCKEERSNGEKEGSQKSDQ